METWVVDTTFYDPTYGNMLCFIPVENLGQPDEAFVVGMNLLTTVEGFKESKHGRLVGLIHADGQEALNEWMAEYPVLTDKITKLAKESCVK